MSVALQSPAWEVSSDLDRGGLSRSRPVPLSCLLEAELRFTADDDFHDHPLTWDLPDGAVALWSRAGSWSARNRKDGFVPAPMLARFCGDPVPAAGELCRRGLWQRVRGGYQFRDWDQLGPVAEQLRQEQAAAEAVRAGKAAGGRLGNHRRWHTGPGKVPVPGCEFCKPAGPPPQPGYPQENVVANRHDDAKPRSDTDRISDRTTDSVPTPRSRSDFDFDLKHSSVINHQVADARERQTESVTEPEPGTPAFRVLVAAELAGRAGTEVDDATADAVAADVLGTRNVPHPLAYVLTAIRRERDPFGRWLAGRRRAPAERRRRDWCGECSPEDRRREDEQGRVYPCPKCSGYTTPAWEAS